jgi:AcrR family transcriptional regulator
MAVRPPQQARSRATWERVLDAGVAILEEDGYDGLTIAALCERAGVTAPTIYARAPAKQTLSMAVYEHAVARLDSSASLEQGSTPRQAVESLATIFLGNARLLRVLINRAGVDEDVHRRGSEETAALARRFRTAVGGDERVADACFRVMLAALAHRVVYGADFDSDIELSDEGLVETLSEMAELYLGRQGRAEG